MRIKVFGNCPECGHEFSATGVIENDIDTYGKKSVMGKVATKIMKHRKSSHGVTFRNQD